MAKKKQPVAKKVKAFFADKANRKYIILAVVVLAVFIVAKLSKKPTTSGDTTGNKDQTGTGGGSSTLPDYSANADTALGSYLVTKGGREFTFSRTPEFEIQFNDDGTITDITSGLNFDGTTNKIGNKRVYYMFGYCVFQNSNGSYNKFENVYLPDGIYTLRQFAADENVAPNLAVFKQKLSGWNGGVNASNSTLSEIFLSVKTTASQGNSAVPHWLRVSRHLVFPSVAVAKDWTPYKKFFCLVDQNKGSTAQQYQNLGANTDLDYSNAAAQPKTWNTTRKGDATIQPEGWFYDQGKGWIERSGPSKRFVLTDEYPENMQGQDPQIDEKMYHFYKGALDRIIQVHGPTNKRDTGLYGSYGIDNVAGLIRTDALRYDRSIYEESLTTHLHDIYDPATSQWAGPCDYYTTGAVNVRNVNHSLYMYNDVKMLPYEIIYVNERVKLGTKTYQGQDREANIIGFGWAKAQSMVEPVGVGIEYASTGEIIPYPNGELHSKENLEIPMPWEEAFTAGFWCTLIFNGVALWNAPGARFGTDASKLHWWTNQPVFWKKTGGSWEPYNSGQNGAPVNSDSGLMHRLWACPIDAYYAGSESVWAIRDRIQVLEHISYQSSKGTFTAQPGAAGSHLNGYGPVNQHFFAVRDALDQGKGVSLRGSGSAGKVLIYYNGNLAPHEYEDNVIIDGVNLGRVYGRQTVSRSV
jgi:hypothetical protein